MQLLRLRLALAGPFGTPLTSGTLFGQLCWAMVRRDGDDRALTRRLGALEAEPCLISDAFPEDHLPRPILPPEPVPPTRERADSHKKLKKLRWLRRERFLRGQLVPGDPPPAEPVELRTAHGTIDRIRNTTPEEAGLYFVDEWWPKDRADRDGPPSHRLDVYVRTAWPATEVEALLAAVGGWGHGRDSSTGRGRFRVEGCAVDRELDAARGSRRVSLSHGCWSANMADGRWKLWTHFGKVGADVTARGGRPWKRPVVLLRPGATWRPTDDRPAGAWITDGLYQDAARVGIPVGLNAFHLAIAYDDPPGGARGADR
jgi:CRISPR-associated protein Csm4